MEDEKGKLFKGFLYALRLQVWVDEVSRFGILAIRLFLQNAKTSILSIDKCIFGE